jgi:transposase, IS30 family
MLKFLTNFIPFVAMKNYHRLTLDERIEIEKLRDQKRSFTFIAKKLNRCVSTITREVKKYKYFNSYQAAKANLRSYEKRLYKKDGKDKISANEKLKNYIHEKLKLRWSPDQISITLKKEFPNDKSMQISHETIYHYIYVHSKKELKNELILQLRQKRKRRGNFKTPAVLAPKIKDRVSIDERPIEVIGREIPGHWEGDLIIGKNHESCLGTLAERTTRTILLIPLKNKEAETVRKGFEKAFKNLPKLMKKSLTYDNGTEMSEHKLFTKNTKVQVYFTHPYSPWERPTNENSNGLIRDYFPKGTDFNEIPLKKIKQVQNELNERPRKVLDYQTPKDVFNQLILNNLQ